MKRVVLKDLHANWKQHALDFEEARGNGNYVQSRLGDLKAQLQVWYPKLQGSMHKQLDICGGTLTTKVPVQRIQDMQVQRGNQELAN